MDEIHLQDVECPDTIARDISNFIGDPDKICDVIVSMSTMLSNEDRQWIIANMKKFTK